MAPDLIVYAIVAAGLVLWLKSVLGTRHGDERQRPNPFAMQPEKAEKNANAFAETDARPASPLDRITALAANPTPVLSVENKTAENGLLDIARADKAFDINFFLDAAQDVFVMIVEAFAKADRETLKDLLEPSVYAAFESALAAREAEGHVINTEILAVRKAQVTAAKLEGRMAFVTLRFQADEITVTKDVNGEIISGHPDRVTPMRDIWTFGRDIRSRDPRWLVYETRGDVEGDNETIPNTH